MDRFYFVPVTVHSPEPGDAYRRPKYFFTGRLTRGPILSRVAMMDYGAFGLMNFGLILAVDISAADDAFLVAKADVYPIPFNLDTSISDVQGTRDYFEAFYVPAQWLTPASSYRELMRQTAGMFQFCQRYFGISGEVLLAQVDLDMAYRNFPSEVQDFFSQAVESFGYDSSLIKPNNNLRQMLRVAGGLWEDRPFYMAGREF